MSTSRPEDSVPMCTVQYVALDGTVFERQTYFYLIQEVLNDFSRMAYEQGTSMSYIHVS